MQVPSLMLVAIAALIGTSWAAPAAPSEPAGYAQQLSTLCEGGLTGKGNSSGTVWLNVTGHAPDKLPYIQQDLGLFTADNLEVLQTTANLAATAASNGNYGDLVYFFNAFAMNGYAPSVNVSSEAMKEGLLASVTPKNATVPDQSLIQLYANTASIPSLRDAFLALQNLSLDPATTDLAGNSPVDTHELIDLRPICSSAHAAAAAACAIVLSQLTFNFNYVSGPRSYCSSGCCVSWSANATFQYRGLLNAAETCYTTCLASNVSGNHTQSCQINGVTLGNITMDQCMSNRADGCS